MIIIGNANWAGNPTPPVDSFKEVVRINNYTVGGNLGRTTTIWASSLVNFNSFLNGCGKSNLKRPGDLVLTQDPRRKKNKFDIIDARLKAAQHCKKFSLVPMGVTTELQHKVGHWPTTGLTIIEYYAVYLDKRPFLFNFDIALDVALPSIYSRAHNPKLEQAYVKKLIEQNKVEVMNA